MIKGWGRALRTMSVGERAIIRITDPELGYGAQGVPPFVPPNACLEFDVEVLDTQLPTTNIDFDSLANADNTPVSIAYIMKIVHLLFLVGFLWIRWFTRGIRNVVYILL